MTARRFLSALTLSLACGLSLFAQAPDLKKAAAEAAEAAASTAKRLHQERYLKANFRVVAALSDSVARPSYSAVRIRVANKDVALGTIVESDGLILTKASEIKGEPKVRFKDGRELTARVVAVHPDHDLALLRVEAKGLQAAEWRESKDDGVGSWVASAGPGDEPVAIGNISVASRQLPKAPTGPNPNSGYFGVRMDEGDGGVKVIEVMKDTAADKAGVKKDDIITTIEDTPVAKVEQMMERLAKTKPGDKITIKAKRDGKPMEFTVTLGKRPPAPFDRGGMQNSMGSTLSDKRTGFPVILQHDTVLKNSDCGGPLVDLDGKVVGINIARAGRTETWAIPAEAIQPIIAELKSGKFPPPRIKEIEEELKKVKADREVLDKKEKALEEELKGLKNNK